jgi:hypothetical protein
MGRKKGIAPHTWLSGPDDVDHELYCQCQRGRAQARYRGEEWQITEAQYILLWRTDDRYLHKGRHNEDLCMTRIDPEKPWHIDNVKIITRLEHYKTCNQFKELAYA